MNGHSLIAGSTMLCPPYFFKRLPPTKDMVAFLYKLFKIPIELRNNMANNALKVIESNSGSSDIQFKHINNLLNHEISNRNN